MLTYVVLRGGKIGEDNNDSSSNVEEDDIYNSSRKVLVLALLLDLYLELKVISVSISGLSFYSILYCLLTT